MRKYPLQTLADYIPREHGACASVCDLGDVNHKKILHRHLPTVMVQNPFNLDLPTVTNSIATRHLPTPVGFRRYAFSWLGSSSSLRPGRGTSVTIPVRILQVIRDTKKDRQLIYHYSPFPCP